MNLSMNLMIGARRSRRFNCQYDTSFARRSGANAALRQRFPVGGARKMAADTFGINRNCFVFFRITPPHHLCYG